jgi:hypothetical protein
MAVVAAIYIAYRQLKADHARSRRERTLDLMQFWTSSIVPHAKKVYAVRDLVAQLESRQCEALWKAEDIKLDAKHKIHLLNALGVDEAALQKTADGEFLIIPREKTLHLREILSFYMNCLEVVFCAWRHNIADSEFIAEEFGALLATPSGSYPLDQIRSATGKYPSVAAFINHSKSLESKRPTSKPVA